MDTNQEITIQPQSRKADLASVYDLTLEELEAWCAEHRHPAYRARQIWGWLYRQRVSSYDEMVNLPTVLRDQLAAELSIRPLEAVRELWTDVDETLKMLYRGKDGHLIETVLMFYPNRATVCVSCQVGCAVGCSFCATGMGGLQRNLTTGEMVYQAVDMARRAEERGRPLTNLVMMGMGEPFHNYAATMKFVGILNDHEGFDFGARRITISTSGIVPFIEKLAEEPYQVNLAVSIHAANDELRSSLVPINDRWPLTHLIAAVRRYIGRTHRRVSFEYALMNGINSSDEQARELADLLFGLRCHVNVIPYNPTPGAPYERPTQAGTERFVAVLEEAGIPATSATPAASISPPPAASFGPERSSHGLLASRHNQNESARAILRTSLLVRRASNMATTPTVKIDFTDPTVQANPYPILEDLRENDPVFWNGNAWLVTRVTRMRVALFTDPRMSSQRIDATFAVLPPDVQEELQPLREVLGDRMLLSDPPKHTRCERL